MSTVKSSVLVAIGLSLVLAACGGSSSNASSSAATVANCKPHYTVKTKNPGVLNVGAIQYPPYSAISNGQAGGIDGDIMAGFAKAACLKMHVQETTFAAAVVSVTTHRNDVAMGDLYRTKARAQAVSLSNPVYLDQLGIVSKSGIGSISALNGKTIATVQGYYFDDAVQKTFGNKVTLLPDEAHMYDDLFAGRAEAGLDSYPAAVAYLKSAGRTDYQVKVPPVDPRIPATGSEAAQSAYAYDSSDAGLGAALNAYLAAIRASGQLGTILGAHGVPASAAKVGPARLA